MTTADKGVANYTIYKRTMREAGEDPMSMGVTNLVDILKEMSGSLKKKPDAALLAEYRRLKVLLMKLRSGAKCPHCGGSLYFSDLEGYDYVCPRCDENFFGFEVEVSE